MRIKKTPAFGDDVTERECEVIIALCRDKTIAALHAEMGISRGTFEQHMKSAMLKTGKRTRTGLVTYALCEKIGEF